MTKQEEIQNLKQEKNAVILAHYYTRPEIQEIADYIGDSYFLSKKATILPHRTIVFCGVSFMGESAKLLNPSKIVLMPDAQADCPMAHMVDQSALKKVRQQYEDLAVVCEICQIKTFYLYLIKILRDIRQKMSRKKVFFFWKVFAQFMKICAQRKSKSCAHSILPQRYLFTRNVIMQC